MVKDMETTTQTATQTPQSDPTSKLEQAIKVARECVDSLILPDNSIYVIDSIIMKRISETVLESPLCLKNLNTGNRITARKPAKRSGAIRSLAIY